MDNSVTYRQAKKAIELFDEEWIGQNHKELWEWAVNEAKELDVDEEESSALPALLPCPFCGAEAGSGWVLHNSVKTDTFQIGCSEECHCHVERQTEAEAIKAWNTRVR